MLRGNKRNDNTLSLQTSVLKKGTMDLPMHCEKLPPVYLDHLICIFVNISPRKEEGCYTYSLSVSGTLSDYKILKEYICERL